MSSPVPAAAADPLAPPRSTGWFDRLLLRGLLTTLIGVAIGGAVTLVPGGSPTTVVYVGCITFFCWLFVDGGRLGAALALNGTAAQSRRGGGWPGWAWMLFVLVCGTAAGYTAGTSLANLLTGGHAPSLLAARPRDALLVLVLSIAPGVAGTYFFWSRARLATAAAAAQRAERAAAEHHLQRLQAQLEPHMLFNTLANLRVLIGTDPARAQAMLDALIAFLRATLGASRTQSHPLATEFARIGDYLALMAVRMGPRLATSFDLPPELAALQVPPLILQPLVENAIKHGLEPQVAGGRIVVRAARDGSTLVLQVRDDGAGLGSNASPTDGTRFGLSQVRDRLATLYGASASVALEAAAGGGTVATIRLPLPEPR